jgi:hypothetical protein
MRPARSSPHHLFAGLLVLAACAGPLAQRTGDARELYREGGFGRGDLRAGGVSFLAPRLSFGRETLGHALLQGLVESLRRELPDASIVHPALAASRINESGLSGLYAQMVQGYDRTGILERESLARISQAIEARYIAVPILVSFREDSATRLSAFGLRIGKTAASNARLQLQVWDAHTGRIRWEGVSDVTLAQEVVRERFVRLERMMEVSWEYLLAQIPNTDVSAPPAKP